MTETLESKIEELSEEVRNAWIKEKMDQGFHSPRQCPESSEHDKAVGKFSKYCDKCHPDLYPYSELPEYIKEYDRVTVRAVLNAIKKLEGEKMTENIKEDNQEAYFYAHPISKKFTPEQMDLIKKGFEEILKSINELSQTINRALGRQ